MEVNKYKIKKNLIDMEKVCYAMNRIDIPDGGIDCSEGCNPYGFSPECAKVMKQLDASIMGPYPHSDILYNAISKFWKNHIDVKIDNIMLTDGSISALYIINSIFDIQNAVMFGIAPQFTNYYTHTEMLGIEYKTYKLKRDNNYKFNLSEFMSMHYINDEIDESSNPKKTCNFIYIDNPNNPTGQSIDIKEIEEIVKLALKKNIIVIVDEAYGDFMPKSSSSICFFNKYPNLVVVRTLSKGFGLAGLRVGYLVADSTLVGYMKKLVNPYMVSEPSRVVAAKALEHEEFIETSKKDFAYMKKEIRKELENCGKLHMAETLDTNSIFMLYHDNKELNLKEEFFKLGVLVIDGYDFKSLDSSAVRVRLPIIDEFHVLLNAIKILNKFP